MTIRTVGVCLPTISILGGGIPVAVRPLLESRASLLFRVFTGIDEGSADVEWAEVNITATKKPPINHIFQADIVHLHGIWNSYSRALSAGSTSSEIVVSPHGMLDPWALKHKQNKKRISSLFYERRLFRNTRCFHALCESEFDAIKKVVPTGKSIAVIPNGVDKQSSVRTIASRANEPYILYLGRLHGKKGVLELCDAWNQLAPGQRFRDWKLLIAGWGEKRYRRKVLSAGRQIPNLEILDPVFGDEKHELLRNASGLILPSKSEGLPMAILEAWSYGVPTIMTAECNLPIGFERNASIACVCEPASICDAITTLITTSIDDREQISKNARTLATHEFNWGIVRKRHQELYDWISGSCDKPSFID
ncbi:MAG: glycosyltransferase [Planctomycetales bacterium]|nr:glycosyltransferase [Planctomycetales bacterium]